jgi:dTDP-4-amino-4,6-dideoxygalactose transaminase
VLPLFAAPGLLVTGDAVREYEQRFAAEVGVRHAFSFWAGRLALYATLRALGVGPGDEVLVQVPTHVVVPNAIRFTGATPVFVDCDRQTLNMDIGRAEALVTPQTRVVVLQHTFGLPADIDGVAALVERHGLILIEDCVHALGSGYRGRRIGTFGTAAFFSTEETKTISTTMGGMLVTDDDQLAELIERFQAGCSWPPTSQVARYLLKFWLYLVLTRPRSYGVAEPLYELIGRRNPLPAATDENERSGRRPSGYEMRLSNAQARLGLSQLDRLDQNVRHRRRIAAIYGQLLAERGLWHPIESPDVEPAYVRYPVRVTDRDAAIRASRVSQLGTWFTSVLEEAEPPDAVGYLRGSCPVAEGAAGRLVNLPTHERVRADDAAAIIRAIADHVEPAAVDPERHGLSTRW